MKTKGLSIKELAVYIGVSIDTVRRAIRRREIPFTRKGTAYRLDWQKVRQAMQTRSKHKRPARSIDQRGAGGDSRPCAAQSPPVGNTGALTTRLVTGDLSVR